MEIKKYEDRIRYYRRVIKFNLILEDILNKFPLEIKNYEVIKSISDIDDASEDSNIVKLDFNYIISHREDDEDDYYGYSRDVEDIKFSCRLSLYNDDVSNVKISMNNININYNCPKKVYEIFDINLRKIINEFLCIKIVR